MGEQVRPDKTVILNGALEREIRHRQGHSRHVRGCLDESRRGRVRERSHAEEIPARDMTAPRTGATIRR